MFPKPCFCKTSAICYCCRDETPDMSFRLEKFTNGYLPLTILASFVSRVAPSHGAAFGGSNTRIVKHRTAALMCGTI